MAIPSGSGSEILKQNRYSATSNSPIKILDGVADHIYTVLNVSFCEQGNAVEAINLFIYPAANSGNVVYLLAGQTLGTYETFVWNDKIVLAGTDELVVQASGSANIDVVVNYIDQDWT